MNTNINPIVVAAREALTAKYRASVAAAKTKYERDLELRFEAAERKRKSDWIAKERYDNPPVRLPNPHAVLTDAGIVRVATEPSDRYRVLGECYKATKDLGFLIESLKVFLYRVTSKSKLSDVLEFLAEWIPTVGDEDIYTDIHSTHFTSAGPVGYGMKNVPATERRVIASGLSPEAVRVLQSFKIKSGVVHFVTFVEFEDRPGQPIERWTYATQDEDLDSSEY